MTNLLPLNLQFFAEEAPDAVENTETKSAEQERAEHMIPKSRFDEVNQRYKETQAQLESLTKQRQDDERKAQEEAGEFKSLYEATSKEFGEFKSQLESAHARNAELEAVVGKLLESRIATIPEEFHDLIPDNLSPEGKLEWVDKAESKGLFRKAAPKPVGEQTNGNEYQGISKESFEKMSYADKVKLYSENPDLYQKLSR